MDRLTRLLREQNPIELRKNGLAVDPGGRLVSVHEMRAQASREIAKNGSLEWTWPFRARVAKRAAELAIELKAPRRMPRGTVQIPADDDYAELLITDPARDV